MNARDRMLARIRERQGKPREAAPSEHAAVRSYIAEHARSPGPRNSWNDLIRFKERALTLASTVEHTDSLEEVPRRVATYLREHELPMQAVCWQELAACDWLSSGIKVAPRLAREGDLVGITGAFCAIAETGTLMLLSGAATPPTVSLLPETHVAIVRANRIVRSMEDAWALLRAEHDEMPRAVTFISGPSRTADIEQTVTLGAHGPYRVHIIIVGRSICAS